MALRYRSAARTHAGGVREVNEDSMIVRDDAALWVVADGMGGHANGQWASSTLVSQFEQLALAGPAEVRASAIVEALSSGNQLIVEAAAAAGNQMGTTAVVVHLVGSEMLCAWVGDSRCYRSRRGELEQLTKDHSVVQDLVDRGSLDPSEVESHPMSNVLSRAVGTEATVQYDGFRDSALPGDHYLLCSDGLTRVVPEVVISRLLSLPNIQTAADRLLSETLERGAPDNVTLVVISVEEATAILEMPK